jgi:hypothetical protein
MAKNCGPSEIPMKSGFAGKLAEKMQMAKKGKKGKKT